MVPTLVVRIAGPEDASTVLDLLYEFNGEALPPDALARRMEQAKALEAVFLCQRDGVVAGLLALRTVPTLSAAQDWAEITELYVRPSFRRMGVGRALVRAAVEYSRIRGCTDIHLLVDPSNAVAHSFYEDLGFRRDSWEMRCGIQVC